MKDGLLGGKPVSTTLLIVLGIAVAPAAALLFVNESDVRLDAPPSFSREIEVVDIDNDGDLDLIIAATGNFPEQCGNTIHYNDGAGFFTLGEAGDFATSVDSTRGLDIADLDGDGFLDIVEANRFQKDRVLRGAAGGAFVDVSSYVRGREPNTRSRDVEIGDIDDDGDFDVNITRTAGNPDRLYLNDGRGHFPRHIDYDLDPDKSDTFDAEFEDLDGDGDLDMVTAILGGQQNDPCPPALYRNLGGGSFIHVSASRYSGPSMRSFDCEAADFDNDGDLDIFFATFLEDQHRILINQGRFYFVEEGEERLPPTFYSGGSTTTGDVDGDGDIDIVVADAAGSPHLHCYLNDGTGHFSDGSAETFPDVEGRPKDVFLADVDRDGDLDLAGVTGGTGLNSEADFLLINTSVGGDLVAPRIFGVIGLPATSVTDRAYPLTINARDNITLIPTAEIHWDAGEGTKTERMERVGGSLLRGFIPAQALGTVVHYYVAVCDETGNQARWPKDANHRSFSITDTPPLGLGVPPGDLVAHPGDTLQVSLELINRTDLAPSVDAWAILEDGQNLRHRVPALSNITIEAQSAIELPATFEVPETLEPGSYSLTFVIGSYPLQRVDSQTRSFVALAEPTPGARIPQ